MAQAISEVCAVPISFRARGEKVEGNNATFLKCKEAQIKAEELVFAHSYGQRAECNVELLFGEDDEEISPAAVNIDGSFFKANIRALKEDGSGEVVFKGEYVYISTCQYLVNGEDAISNSTREKG